MELDADARVVRVHVRGGGAKAREAEELEAQAGDAGPRLKGVAYGGERAQGNALDPSPAQNSSLANEPPQGRREPNTLDGLRQGSKIARVEARSIGDRNFLIAAGTFIPCVLQTAMDSSQPGFVTCVIPKDIFNEAHFSPCGSAIRSITDSMDRYMFPPFTI